MEQRIFAIGDVHGHAGKLRRLLRKLTHEAGMNEDDILVQLGDIVDRGPDVKACIDRLLEMEENMECHWIRGNHENMMLRAIGNDRAHQGIWDVNGGTETRRSYHRSPVIYNCIPQWILEVPMSHRDFIYRQEYYWETEHYHFSHGPIPKRDYAGRYISCDTDSSYLKAIKTPVPDTDIYTWSWHGNAGVDEAEYAAELPGKLQVVGHVHDLMNNLNNTARVYDHIAYIDGGCGCHPSGRLYAIELPSQKLYYVE